MRQRGRIRRRITVLRRREHHTRAIGRPYAGHIAAGRPGRAIESRRGHECRARKQVPHRPCRQVQRHQVRLAVVQPVVPIANRKALIHPRVVLPPFPLRRGLLVGLLARRSPIHTARKHQRFPVGRPRRVPRPRAQRRDPLGLAPRRNIQQVKLCLIVSVALGRKHDPRRIGRPTGPALRPARECDLPRCRRAIGSHQPQVRTRVLGIIRGLPHAEYRPLAVRTRHRRPHLLHLPHLLVRNRGLRLEHGRRHNQPGDERGSQLPHMPVVYGYRPSTVKVSTTFPGSPPNIP